MAIEMVRTPSETPNISNTDDFVGFRYAYGNQNGYVIGRGSECSYTINGSIFRINSGRLVLQGVECDIDANGVDITVDNVATTRYYTIYLQVNLALNTATVKSTYDTASYPDISAGDDLTNNTTGTANMILYKFDVASGVIDNVQKIVSKIEYTGTSLSDYNVDNGTVEERFYNLENKKLYRHFVSATFRDSSATTTETQIRVSILSTSPDKINTYELLFNALYNFGASGSGYLTCDELIFFPPNNTSTYAYGINGLIYARSIEGDIKCLVKCAINNSGAVVITSPQIITIATSAYSYKYIFDVVTQIY